MLLDLGNGISLIDFTVQHRLDKINRALAHDPGDAKLMIDDLVDAVERVFFVDEGVEQDPQRPDVLLFAAVWDTTQNFGCGII